MQNRAREKVWLMLTGADLCNYFSNGIHYGIRRFVLNSMVAVLDDDLLPSCRQSCKTLLELMHPDLMKRSGLPVFVGIPGDEIFAGSKYDHGPVP